MGYSTSIPLSKGCANFMPAFYAHYRFGGDVLRAAAPKIRTLCEKHRALFDIGLHGPDIFFFYRPVLPNSVARLGHACHGRTCREFLARARKVVENTGNKEASLAYFYGFLCHFALDSICHPYVAEAMDKYGTAHSAIETAFDRLLLTTDGIDPCSFDPCGHFDISRKNAAVIAPFFPPMTSELVEKSLRSMVFYGRLLYNQNKILRKTMDISLYFTLHHDALFGMMMTPGHDKRCESSNHRLSALYLEALTAAQELFREASIYIESGTPAGQRFDLTFKG